MLIKLHIVSNKGTLLDRFIERLHIAINPESINVVKLPTKKRLFTVLKSPFVNKKSREQFGISTHRRLVILREVDLLIFSHFLKGISCKGVSFKISFKGG
jgi:ribosomal protein S10